IEATDLFEAGVGTHTDIVEKEMYSWVDKLNDDKLTLRPEGTAGCVRAVVQGSLTYNGPIKLFYRGAMFRHENVQKGRQRQFHQLGIESFGLTDPSSDAEQIIMLNRLWKALGLEKKIHLEINSIGDAADREKYRDELIHYFEENIDVLDDDAKRRLHKNPLRILDSKNPLMQDMLDKAPKLIDSINEEAKNHFNTLCQILSDNQVNFKLNKRLVRGLDYYNRTVFEWITSELGSQGTVAGGGRYDYLVERLGGKPTAACGFAIGIERIILLLENASLGSSFYPDIYIVNLGNESRDKAFMIAESLRDQSYKVSVNLDSGSFKSQMKKADKSNAKIALIIGENELKNKLIQVKLIRKDGSQTEVKESDIISFINNNI
ncbi:MAG: histidine--tRNA ligase, partial [Nitrosomonadales bacterium]|nr:histidine--tRNA ligase [Nitrosomonadales bacterium]